MSPALSTASRQKRNDALCELRRTEIIAAAIKVFGRKGFGDTRADDIAAAARIAKGTLYLYFKSKEAIYAGAVAYAVRELQAEIARATASAGGFRERLSTAIEVRLAFWPEHEGIYRLLMTVGREPRHRKQTNEVLQNAHTGLLSIFEDGVNAGTIEPQDFAPLAWATLDMTRGANERRMDKLSRTTPQQDAVWISACVLRQVRFRA